MKNTSSSKTGTIGAILIIVAVVAAYFYYRGGSATGGAGLASEDLGGVGLSELNILNHVESIRLDTALFKDQIYMSLRDYSVDIPPQPVGRANPFEAIIGSVQPSTR